MLTFLTAAALAAAPAGPPPPPDGLTWAAVDRRSTVVYNVASTTYGVGLTMTMVGIAANSAPVVVAGLALEVPSAPVMASAALRGAKSIRGRGGSVMGVGGYASHALSVAALGMFVRAEVEARSDSPDPSVVTLSRFAGGGLHLAAFAAGGMQGFANTNARRELPQPKLRLGVVPRTNPPGLALVGQSR